jgi:hypothetical protein
MQLNHEPEAPTRRAGPPSSHRAPMVTIDDETFWGLRKVLRAATKDCLRETFGVSETTWVKLRDGRPVKQITLARLMVRYQRILQDELSRGDRISAAA